MNFGNIARNILLRGDLESKITINEQNHDWNQIEEISTPVRDEKITISEKQIKFPSPVQLNNPEKKALALHFFANHELLAIELFAWALLNFELEDRDRKNLLSTIQDEQKHLMLYLKRMRDFHVELGDFPLNGFLWNSIAGVESLSAFYAMTALTFEQANLDFMKFYMTIFQKMNDEKTYSLLEVVYNDEIKHVARGVDYLNRNKEEQSLWDYYRNLLPGKMTPARGKGKVFDREGRTRAGIDLEFISKMEEYFDDFAITNRKEWKNIT